MNETQNSYHCRPNEALKQAKSSEQLRSALNPTWSQQVKGKSNWGLSLWSLSGDHVQTKTGNRPALGLGPLLLPLLTTHFGRFKRDDTQSQTSQTKPTKTGATTTATTYYPLRPLQEGRYSKSNFSNQTYQTKLTTLNLLNQTFLGWVHYCYFLPTTGDYKSSTHVS